MDLRKLENRIVIDEKVMVGKPIIRGFRITVEHLLNQLASGISYEQILQSHPELEVEDIYACLHYASNLMNAEKVYKVA